MRVRPERVVRVLVVPTIPLRYDNLSRYFAQSVQSYMTLLQFTGSTESPWSIQRRGFSPSFGLLNFAQSVQGLVSRCVSSFVDRGHDDDASGVDDAHQRLTRPDSMPPREAAAAALADCPHHGAQHPRIDLEPFVGVLGHR